MFVTAGVVLGALVSILPVMVVLSQDSWSILCRLVVSAVMTVAIMAASSFVLQVQEENFNNGYCPYCNVKYQAIDHSHGDTYYECPECFYGCWY